MAESTRTQLKKTKTLDILSKTELDSLIKESFLNPEKGLGTQECICCTPPRCCSAAPCCKPTCCCKPSCCKPCCSPCKPCCTPPCGPCGAFGPIKCPCELNCAPKGTHCCVIKQPNCCLSVPGCMMCNNAHCIPRQPTWSPRCCGMP